MAEPINLAEHRDKKHILQSRAVIAAMLSIIAGLVWASGAVAS